MAQLCLNLLNFSPRRDGGVDVREQLDAAAEAGARLIGLDAGSVRHFLSGGASIGQLEREIAQRGLSCYEMLYLECTPANPEGTLAAAERLGGWAGALGAEYLLTSCPTPVEPPSVEIFARCCDVMARCGTALSYEFFPWAPINTFALASEFVRAAGRPNARVIIDCWHFLHGSDDWKMLDELPLDELAYVQFTDSVAVEPENYAREAQTCRRIPGEGCLELERFCSALKRRGFDGVVSLEVLSPETRALGPREYARRCWESAQRYWA